MASRSGQLLRRLPELVPGDRTRPAEGALSPVSPLERNPESPKGWKKRESDGVGLGIVAALERTFSGEKSPGPVVVAGAANSHAATAPIAIGSTRAAAGRRSPTFEAADPGCGAGGVCDSGRACGRAAEVCGDARRKETGFCFGESTATAEESEGFRIADFLNCCYLCRKRLHGEDIYIYRGEKAFCSAECRYQQMVSDEHQEKCGLGVRSTPEISSSPYSGAGRLFFTGIVVS